MEQSPEDAQKAIDTAYAYWINDSFWLNPLVKLFDDGVERALLVASWLLVTQVFELSYGAIASAVPSTSWMATPATTRMAVLPEACQNTGSAMSSWMSGS